MNRRKFLKQSATLSAAALAGARKVEARPPRRGPNEEIRVACVGIRGMGRGHVGAHANAKNVRVVTLCDVDERLFDDRIKIVEESGASRPKTEYDVRRVIDDKDVDCISTATPNHWHALITIWACQAGKDVYVQKPASHNIFEGRQMVEAARKYKRIVQVGTQIRSHKAIQQAVQLLREGVIGDVYMARGLCYKGRGSIGFKDDEPAPEGVHYDLWLGPAPKRPFNPNRFHYNWHWHWDYGNGDLGNQGVHQVDVAMWCLGKCDAFPVKAHSMGGRYTYKDQGQTANTQVCTFQYDDGKLLVFEVRGRPTNRENGVGVGNIIYGSKGYMTIPSYTSFSTTIDGKPGPSGDEGGDHFENFHEAVRSRDVSHLNAPIHIGYRAATLCHMANTSYRLGRSLEFDPGSEMFVNDKEANAMRTRAYRESFVVPREV
jgi:predicted dehydrogenase